MTSIYNTHIPPDIHCCILSIHPICSIHCIHTIFMTIMATPDMTALDHIFTHETSTHVTDIHWTSLGPDTAPPLIFVHGTPWSSRVWAPLAKALSSRFRVYLFDNPGYGKTGASVPINPRDDDTELSVSLATQAKAFAALYHQCWHFDTRDNRPHVIAHDYGGIITLRAHLLHECEYASLCLINALAVRPFGSPFFRVVAEQQNVFHSIPDAVFEGMVRGYVSEAGYKALPKDIEDMLVKPWLNNGTQGPQAFVRQIAQTEQRDVEEVEGEYWKVGRNMPVKIVWGLDDHWIPVDRADILYKMLGAQQIVKLPQAGHLIMYDQPEALTTEIAHWLATLGHF